MGHMIYGSFRILKRSIKSNITITKLVILIYIEKVYLYIEKIRIIFSIFMRFLIIENRGDLRHDP